MSLYHIKLAKGSANGIELTTDGKNLLSHDKYFIDCSTVYGRERAYKECDIVRSVIGVGASHIANLKLWALDPVTGKTVKSRAIDAELAKLKRPNLKEDFNIFFKKLDSQVKLHGVGYVRIIRSGGEEFYYVIPTKFVQPIYKIGTDIYSEWNVDYYIVNTGASSYTLKPNEVHIFSDVVLASDNYSFFGGSRLESLSEVVTTYVTLWETLTEMYANRGALNVIGMGVKDANMMSLSATQKEKESFYEKLKNFGLRRQQNKNLVTSLDAKVSKISADMQEMIFPDIIKESKKAVCTAFNIPSELFGIESARFKTVPEARKESYTQGAIPTLEYYLSEWKIMRGIKDVNYNISPDFSHLDFYQEAKLQESVAFQQMSNAVVPLVTNGLMSMEEARIKLDLE